MGFERKVRQVVFCAALGVLSGCALSSGPSFEGELRPYTIQRGDTIFDLAQRSGISTDDLGDLNNLDDPDKLHIGQVIYIPAKGTPPTHRASPPDFAIAAVPDPELIQRSAAAASLGTLIWPVDGGQASSRFGTRSGTFHEGLDIRASTGTSIFAAHSGQVVFSGNEWSGYGNMVVIKGGGIYTVYAHNHENFVDTGDEVEQGDEIASVGRSGNASGCHLHFEVRVDDPQGLKVAVNPALFLKRKRVETEAVVASAAAPVRRSPPAVIAADGERY